MLTRLRLQHFKSWSQTGDVELRPITGMFGTNSSGKTSLLQAILLLKQTAGSSDRGLVLNFGDNTTAVDLGDFSSVVYGHEIGPELEISVDWSAGKPFQVRDFKQDGKLYVESPLLGFSTRVGQPGKRGASNMAVTAMEYRVGPAIFVMEQTSRAKYQLTVEGTDFAFVRSVGRKWPLPPPVRCYGFPDQVRAYFQNAGFLADLELSLEERLRNVFYLGPLRAYPERRYMWAGAQPMDMGRAGESVIDALLASRERGEKISPGWRRKRLTLEAYVANWLKHLGLIHEFRVEAIAEGSQVYRVLVKKSPASAEVLITDVGFGVSQILPVLVLLFYVPEGSTVILEQPEIHLHPAVQAGLADVLIDAWKRRRVQVIVESHSEHLLRRLQRRVAESEVPAGEIGLYFCSMTESGSALSTLDLDMYGMIRNWPEEFFGDEFGEIAAIRKAALARQRKGTAE